MDLTLVAQIFQKWLVFANFLVLPYFLPQLANLFSRIYPPYPWHIATLPLYGVVDFYWMINSRISIFLEPPKNVGDSSVGQRCQVGSIIPTLRDLAVQPPICGRSYHFKCRSQLLHCAPNQIWSTYLVDFHWIPRQALIDPVETLLMWLWLTKIPTQYQLIKPIRLNYHIAALKILVASSPGKIYTRCGCLS